MKAATSSSCCSLSAFTTMLLSPIVICSGGVEAERLASQARTTSTTFAIACTPGATPTTSAPIAATSSPLDPSGAGPADAWSTRSTSSTSRISARNALVSASISPGSASGPLTNSTRMSSLMLHSSCCDRDYSRPRGASYGGSTDRDGTSKGQQRTRLGRVRHPLGRVGPADPLAPQHDPYGGHDEQLV